MKKREITHRKAKKSDIPQLVKMRWDFQLVGKESYQSSEKKFVKFCNKFFKEQFDSKRWVHFLAETNQEIIAQVSLQVIKNIPIPGRLNNCWGFLTNAYTKPKFRNRGIGTELVRLALRWADNNDLRKIILWPREASISIYRNFGFSQKSNIMERKKD